MMTADVVRQQDFDSTQMPLAIVIDWQSPVLSPVLDRNPVSDRT